MSKHTLSQAKNLIRKTFVDLIDSQPSAAEVGEMWKHFQSKCAYCERELSKASRQAHLDHLVASGGNHISNRVLACNVCNGDEKRDRAWEIFLVSKCTGDPDSYERRSNRILEWQKKAPKAPPFDEELVSKAQQAIDLCNAIVEDNYRQIKRRILEKELERVRGATTSSSG